MVVIGSVVLNVVPGGATSSGAVFLVPSCLYRGLMSVMIMTPVVKYFYSFDDS